MGQSIVKLLGVQKPARILLLGLDAAGKTTLLYKLKLDENVSTVPTIGFNVEEIKIGRNLNFVVIDVGGQERIRPLWKHYFTNCQTVIFVVDSEDEDRLNEAKYELLSILNAEEMKNVPVVILANKQDLPNAMSPDYIGDRLNVSSLNNDHRCCVHPCSALSSEGLLEAMEIVDRFSRDYTRKFKQ